MALGPSTSAWRDSQKLSADAKVGPSGNDAFSFWKLQEEWRSRLGAAIDESQATAERYLFELYLSEKQRRPPAALGSYYRFRNFIPRPLRHWLNSAAIRARGHGGFPNWPCESVLLDFWRDWLDRALRSLDVEDGWHIGFWPHNARCCIVLTHDVESPLGVRRM